MKRKRLFIVSLCVIIVVVIVLFLINRPERQFLYKVTYLPSLGGESTLPCSINDKGQIAGFFEVAKGGYHLFLWDREKGLKDLGPVMPNSLFIHINNTGQIAANMKDPNRHDRAFIWDPNHGRRILPTLGGETASAYNINNHGQVVGTSRTTPDITGIRHACVWNSASEIHDLTPFSNRRQHTRAWSINDANQVIISSSGGLLLIDANETISSTSLPIPLHGSCEINNAGNIVGLVGEGRSKPDVVIWNPDAGAKKLVQLNVSRPLEIKGLNDINQVLILKERWPKFILFNRGFFSPPVKNYLYDPKRGCLPLNGYVSVGSHEEFRVTNLNNKGCIVGAVQSRSTNGSIRSRGVLLEPIPEQWEK